MKDTFYIYVIQRLDTAGTFMLTKDLKSKILYFSKKKKKSE